MGNFAIMYLTTFGEWMEVNGLVLLSMVVGWLISLGGLIWYLSGIAANTRHNGVQLEALSQSFEDHQEAFRKHEGDSNVHTTFEQRQAINARFAEIKHEMADGHTRIENKIDKLIDRLIR